MVTYHLFAYFVHHFDPFLIRFNGNFGIRYYGLAYFSGFIASALLLRHYYFARKTWVDPNDSLDLIFALVVGVIVGGRLGYFLLYDTDIFWDDPLAIFRVWEGGMASHSGFVGVCLVLVWFSWHRHISFFHLGDLVTTSAPAGFFFGRIANFINGELCGKISTVPWAVIFQNSAPNRALSQIPPRHPSQLYEAGLEGVALFIYMQMRFWRSDVTARQPGRLAGEFLVIYAIVRIISERFREPDATLILGLSRGTFYSFFLVEAGILLIIFAPAKIREQILKG